MKRLSDTSPEAQRVLTEAYRAMSPARKLQLQVEDFRLAKSLHGAGVLQRNPHSTRSQLRDSWNSMMLGMDLWNCVRSNALMDRPIENLDIVLEVVAAFDQLGVVYAIGGSWASSLYGESRSTRDADITAAPFPGKEVQFVQCFSPDYYLSLEAVQQAVRDRSTFNIINTSAGFKVDVFILKDRPFDQSLLRRRVVSSLAELSSQSLNFVSAEDIILLKLEWYRLGGNVSERQWLDVLGVLRTQADRLDNAYLSKWAPELGVSDLLDRARQDADV